MHNLMRFWYQNKNQIIKVGAIVIFVFLIIQVVNLFVKRNNEKKFENVMNGTNINANNTSSTENNTVISDKSAITGQNVSSKQLSTDTNTINNFINYCNQKDLEKAYSMLTEDCKSQIYPALHNSCHLHSENSKRR